MDDEFECLYCQSPLTKLDETQPGDFLCEWCHTRYNYDDQFDELEEYDELDPG